jgi:mannosyltransferase OCH1-like enzyme
MYKIKKIFINIRNYIRDHPYKPIENETLASEPLSPETFKIPLHCIQTWEENLFPKTHRNSIELFRAKNSSFTFQFFDRDQREKFMFQYWGQHEIFKIYQDSRFGVMQADIFRYCVLYTLGGFYIDIAKSPPNTLLNYLSSNPKMVLFAEKEMNSPHLYPVPTELLSVLTIEESFMPILNSMIACIPEHPLLKKAIDNIVHRWKYFKDFELKYPRYGILSLTGPAMLLHAYHEYIQFESNRGMVKVIPISDLSSINLIGSEARWVRFPSYMDARYASLSLSSSIHKSEL